MPDNLCGKDVYFFKLLAHPLCALTVHHRSVPHVETEVESLVRERVEICVDERRYAFGRIVFILGLLETRDEID